MPQAGTDGTKAGRPYEAPTIKVMNEDEVLRNFQLTSAMGAWWVPGGPVST